MAKPGRRRRQVERPLAGRASGEEPSFAVADRHVAARAQELPRGPFLSCSRYPDCKYRANKQREGRPRPEAKTLDEPCPVCGKPMVERQGRYGPFKSCSDYPRCKGPKAADGRLKTPA